MENSVNHCLPFTQHDLCSLAHVTIYIFLSNDRDNSFILANNGQTKDVVQIYNIMAGAGLVNHFRIPLKRILKHPINAD